jgi:arylsulfatase A
MPFKIIFAYCLLLFTTKSFAQTRPNIIFILADDLGYGDIGCYGQQKIKTPNIDRLAKEGMQFMQFYSGSTVCAPARATFMTGLHTGHTPIRGNKTFKPEGQFPLPPGTITVAAQLQKQGYNTAAFGKWSMGFITTSGDPQKQGFDNFYGYNCQTLAHDYYPDHLWENHERIDFKNNPEERTVYSADAIHQKAIAYINQQNGKKPFFVYLPYTLPHADLDVPHDSTYNYYVKAFNDFPDTTAKSKTPNKFYEPYRHAALAAMISRLDKYVGEITAVVDKKGMAKNTLIIFTSDNGPHKEDGNEPNYFNSNGGFRGIKRDLYEGGIREPFVARWPGKISAGTKTDVPAILYDLYPTFLQLANAKIPSNLDGISIANLLLGKIQKPHEFLYWELHESGGKQAIRMGKWKGVKLDVSIKENSALELYDLDADPQEKNNIAAQHPVIVKQLEQRIQKAHLPNKDWPLLVNN